jgi:chitosanase
MNLTKDQVLKIIKIVYAFESGTDYSTVTIERDGDGGMLQISYGAAQVTEYGLLRELLEDYIERAGVYSDRIKAYLPRVGVKTLTGDLNFRNLLHNAGKYDPVMQEVQDQFFYDKYFTPALDWAKKHQFTLPLSMLVIFDSYIHSGCMLEFLRNRFSETTPKLGGNEKNWIKCYVDVRHEWLRTHTKKILNNCVYRTQTFKNIMEDNDWYIVGAINANGHKIK